MESWGGEFLDTEWYAEGRRVVPSQPELIVLPEPWRELKKPGLLLPTDLVYSLRKQEDLERAAKETEKLAEIRTQILRDGFWRPLILVASEDGRLVLEDGHHRITIAMDLGITHVPVWLKRSERMRVRARPFQEVVLDLLTLAAEHRNESALLDPHREN